MNISDKRLEEALVERAKTDEKHAELKTKVEYLDWEKKHLKDSSPNFSISQVKKYLNDLN